MELIRLLGQHMKSPEVYQYLCDIEATIHFGFDITGEDTDDDYTAFSKRDGVELVFDHEKILRLINLYMRPVHGFTPFNRANLDVPVFETFDQAKATLKGEGVHFITNGQPEDSPRHKWWIKADFRDFRVGYNFDPEHGVYVIRLESRVGT